MLVTTVPEGQVSTTEVPFMSAEVPGPVAQTEGGFTAQSGLLMLLLGLNRRLTGGKIGTGIAVRDAEG